MLLLSLKNRVKEQGKRNLAERSSHTVILPLARIIKPASISRCTIAAFLLALASANTTAPAHVVMPSSDAVMKQS